MAQLKSAVYQGVEELSEEECLAIARLKTKTADLTVESVTMKPLSDAPAGFLGDHYKVAIAVRLAPSDRPTDLHFFVKTKPRAAFLSECGENMGAFKRECDFFSMLLLQFRKYTHVPEGRDEDAKHWSPDCYLANDKLIVLDDLSHQGFRLTDGRLGLDFAHCAVLLRTLARFHAASVIFEEKEGQRLGKTVRIDQMYPEMVREGLWTKEAGNVGTGRQICDAGVNAALSLARVMRQASKDPERYDRASAALRGMFDDGCLLVRASGELRNVVCHGDLWANNLLFRYDSKGVPCDGRLIDYQLLRYAAPATDVMTTLYLITRRATRETHFADLVKEYHATLTEELERHGLDVERIAPWTAFKASLEQYRWLGILICFVYYPTTMLAEDAAIDVVADPELFRKFILEDQSNVALESFKTDENYRVRLTEIIEELADYLSNKQLPEYGF